VNYETIYQRLILELKAFFFRISDTDDKLIILASKNGFEWVALNNAHFVLKTTMKEIEYLEFYQNVSDRWLKFHQQY